MHATRVAYLERQPFSVTVRFAYRWAVPLVTYLPLIADRYDVLTQRPDPQRPPAGWPRA